MDRLAEVEVRNYRSIRHGRFPLADYTPVVGPNNAGKSNLLAAIRWLLRASPLPLADFNNPGEPLVVSGTIVGVSSELFDRLAPEHRARIAPFCQEARLRIRRTQPTPSCPAGRVTLHVRRPEVSDEESPTAWAPNPTGIDAAIKRLFPEPIEIGAMQDVPDDVAKTKASSTIGKLIAEIIGPIEEQHGAAIRRALEEVRRRLAADGDARAPELERIDAAANEKLKELFPGLKVRLHVPMPDVKELFKGGTIRVFEGEDGLGRNLDALGHGAQRAIQMALVRSLAELRGDGEATPARTLLLIEEPELYMHPQAVEQIRTALSALSSGRYQVVFSTHSPLLIGHSDLGDALVIQKPMVRGTEARPSLRHAVARVIADQPSQAATLFELGNATQILFSERVILVEGRTEHRLLPVIFHLETGKLLSAKIGFVAPGGVGNIPNCLRILEVMGIQAKAIVDLDFAFRQGLQAGIVEGEDTDLQACRPLFTRLSIDRGIVLASDGFPQKGNGHSAAEGFALFAALPEAQPMIERLHARLLERRIWLWTRGACEEHIGLAASGEDAWGRCAVELKEQGCSKRLADYGGVRAMLAWLQS